MSQETVFPKYDSRGFDTLTPIGGMTLRDYFAGQALVALLASPHNKDATESVARLAVIHADDLLAALAEKPK